MPPSAGTERPSNSMRGALAMNSSRSRSCQGVDNSTLCPSVPIASDLGPRVASFTVDDKSFPLTATAPAGAKGLDASVGFNCGSAKGCAPTSGGGESPRAIGSNGFDTVRSNKSDMITMHNFQNSRRTTVASKIDSVFVANSTRIRFWMRLDRCWNRRERFGGIARRQVRRARLALHARERERPDFLQFLPATRIQPESWARFRLSLYCLHRRL